MLLLEYGLMILPLAQLSRATIVAEVALHDAEDDIFAETPVSHGDGSHASGIAPQCVVDLFGAKLT
eukprot:5947982-Pyramimonas_sp.AAC.2